MTGATDLDGNPRIYDGIVDMGAYEWVPEPTMFWIFDFGFWICISTRRISGYITKHLTSD